MLVDRYGRDVYVDDWFIRLDQNDEGRLYQVLGYPAPDRIMVHEYEHIHSTGGYPYKVIGIKAKRLTQTINMPRTVLWYPQTLLPGIIQ